MAEPETKLIVCWGAPQQLIKLNNIQVYHQDTAFELPFWMSGLLMLSLRVNPNMLQGKLISATRVTTQGL